MLAGYQSDTVAPELVSDFRVVDGSLSINPDYDGACERNDGSEGVKSGHAILNQTPHTIEIRGFSALTSAGSTETSTYEPGEVLLGPNAYQTLTLCEPAGGTSRFGTEYVESWMTYYDPTADRLVESLHLLWDADYSGTYAEVRTTSSSEGGAQVTPPARSKQRVADRQFCAGQRLSIAECRQLLWWQFAGQCVHGAAGRC